MFLYMHSFGEQEIPCRPTEEGGVRETKAISLGAVMSTKDNICHRMHLERNKYIWQTQETRLT